MLINFKLMLQLVVTEVFTWINIQKTTEKKKQAIIQAALQLFKEKGFKETSIKSIAEVAESITSFYLQLFRGQR